MIAFLRLQDFRSYTFGTSLLPISSGRDHMTIPYAKSLNTNHDLLRLTFHSLDLNFSCTAQAHFH